MPPQQLVSLIVVILLLGAHAYLMSVALPDLFRPDRVVRGYDKRVWALVIGFIGIVGPLAYLYVGRENA